MAGLVQKTENPSFSLKSFVTPDKKKYSIKYALGDDNKWEDNVELRKYARNPIDFVTLRILNFKQPPK